MKVLLMAAKILSVISAAALLMVAADQGKTETVLSANVPFDFQAGHTSLPAGTYNFKLKQGEQSILISGPNATEVKVPIVSRLAGANLFKDTGLVFDAFGGHHMLSEVWIPGEGGALVYAAPKQHPHEMVIAVVSGSAPQMSGQEVYESTCARCHGPQGKGNPAADRFFKVSIPRLDSARVQAKSDQELKDIISHGRRSMPPVRMWKAPLEHLLYPESVDGVIAYVRTFKPK